MSRTSIGPPDACLAEGAGRLDVREKDPVGDGGDVGELVAPRGADERERRQGVGGEPHERRQARVGEAGAAGLEHRLADARLAVDAPW